MTGPSRERMAIAAAVLAKASAYDNRRAESDEDRRLKIAAWAEALHPATTRDDALRAVAEHYSSSDDWLTVNRLNAMTRRYRAKRLGRALIPYPEGLGDHPAAETRWRAEYHTAIATGSTPEQAHDHAWQIIKNTYPKEITK